MESCVQCVQTYMCIKWHFCAVLPSFSHQDTHRKWKWLATHRGRWTRLLTARAMGQGSAHYRPCPTWGSEDQYLCMPNGNLCSIDLTLFKKEAKKYRVQRSKWPWILLHLSFTNGDSSILSSWPQRVKWVSNKMMDVKVLCLGRKEIRTCGNRCYYFTLNSKIGLRH